MKRDMKWFEKSLCGALLLVVSLFCAADLPTVLKDTIQQGSGTLDLLKDITSTELGDYLETYQTLYLGVDLNEAANGYESSTSVGVAIEEVVLSIQTTAGSYSFSSVYTNTTAQILADGASDAGTYNTLFGTAGSSEIAGNSTDFSALDDVLEVHNVTFDGEILAAAVDITFVVTADAGANEDYFDFSAGKEEFAVISSGNADDINNLANGVIAAPNSISFQTDAPAGPSGSPEPFWYLMLLIPFILWLRLRTSIGRAPV